MSFLISFVAMPVIIKLCNKFNIYDYQDERKIHTGEISRLGGVGIFLAFIISAFLYLYFDKRISIKANLPVLISAIIIFALAIIDDIHNLPAIIKLLGQLIAAAIVTTFGYRFTQVFGWHIPTVLSYIITFCWIVGAINAYNLIDGLDALCGSLSFTATLTLGLLFLFSKSPEAEICFILAAAILGFLCFNWPPAKLFMGDSGSQFLGFMIAILPLYTTSSNIEYNKIIIIIILTSFPIFDTIAAIWRRLRDHRPVMSADKSHLHHKLLNLGYTKTQALWIIIVLQLTLCCSIIISFFLDRPKSMALLFETVTYMILFFSIIHFANRKAIREHKGKLTNMTPDPVPQSETPNQ